MGFHEANSMLRIYRGLNLFLSSGMTSTCPLQVLCQVGFGKIVLLFSACLAAWLTLSPLSRSLSLPESRAQVLNLKHPGPKLSFLNPQP